MKPVIKSVDVVPMKKSVRWFLSKKYDKLYKSGTVSWG